MAPFTCLGLILATEDLTVGVTAAERYTAAKGATVAAERRTGVDERAETARRRKTSTGIEEEIGTRTGRRTRVKTKPRRRSKWVFFFSFLKQT